MGVVKNMASHVKFEASQQSTTKSESPSMWEGPNPQRYSIQKNIGEGSYGTVYKAFDQKLGKPVAVKHSKHIFQDVTDCKRMLREISILNRSNSRNVVKLLDMRLWEAQRTDKRGVVHHEWDMALTLELCEYDLKKLFKANVTLDTNHTRTLFYRICQGVEWLHLCGVWHRDLKPANILVNLDCTVKICDFGLARATGEPLLLPAQLGGPESDTNGSKPLGKRNLTSHVVTRWYRAPELILLHANYTSQIDLWSLGCILVELLMMEERYGGCEPSVYHKRRGPIFPGNCCYPLSPRSAREKDASTEREQLKEIFLRIGCPSREDYEFLSREDAKKYVRNVCEGITLKGGNPRGRGFVDRLGCQPDMLAMDLINKLLRFNPTKRATITDCLRHGFLEFPRQNDETPESLKNVPEPIKLPCDAWTGSVDLTEKQLMTHLRDEESYTRRKAGLWSA